MSTTVMAQDTSGPDMPEEIVVTAMKREAAIQDIGAAITAIGGEEVKLKNIDSGADLQFYVPNLVYASVSGTAQYTIRGVGLGVDSGLAEPGVAVHIDGLFLPRASQTNIVAGDIERLEVLRGPQGTLYGRNATGGVINFITNKPGEEIELGASFGGAEYDERSASLTLNVPLWDDRVILRAFGDFKDRGPHVMNLNIPSHSGGDYERFNLRFTGRVNITPDLSADMVWRQFRTQSDWPVGQIADDLTGIWTDLDVATAAPHQTKADGGGPFFQNIDAASLTLNWQSRWFDVKSLTGWTDEYLTRENDIDGTALGMFNAVNHQFSNAWTQEINVSGDLFSGRLHWIAGGFYFTEDARLRADNRAGQELDDLEQELLGFANLPISPNDIIDLVRDRTIIAENFEENESVGLFADLTFEVTDALRLIAGARWARDEKTSDVFFHNATADCQEAHSVTSEAISPKAAVEWDITEDIMVYGQYQEATKPGGIGIGSANCNNVFDAEELSAVEAGIKSNWFDDRLTANLTGFSYDYDNYQAFQIIGIAAVTENAPKAKSDGAELELVAKPFDFISMNLNATWLDARFEEYSSVDPLATGIGRVFLGVSADEEDLSGNPLVRSPKYTLSGGAQVMFPLPFLPVFDGGLARIDAFWTDEISFRPYYKEWDRRPAYTVMNATLAFASDDQRIRLRAYVKNITDEHFVMSTFAVAPIAVLLGTYNTPRTFGAALNVSF